MVKAHALGRAMLVVLALLALALAAGSIGPRNPGWRAAGPDGITIFIETNGVHTGFILPAASFADLVPPATFAPLPPPRWLAIGWGQADFYRRTRTWADIDPWLTAKALIGSRDTVLHIEARPGPRPDRWRRAVRIDAATYRRLIASVRASFAPGAVPTPGYGPDSRFFAATGTYSALMSCNVWTGNRLADAGMTAPLWAPMEGGVMRWYPAGR